MTLEQLRVFVAVVRAGSFTKAAERLETQKSHVSRVVAQLEAELGVKLLERTTRTLSITEAGREIHERAVGILAAVEDTGRVAQNMQGEPGGKLRLTCGTDFAMLAVGDWIAEYLTRHPAVSVDAEYTSRVLDVVHEGFDIAIRIGRVQESRLVARPLGHLEYGLFACPRYLARHGTPPDLEALRQHRLVMFSGGQHRRGWALARAGGREAVRFEAAPRLSVNNSFSVRDALLRSLGVGLLPLRVAREPVASGRLVPVLRDWRPEPVPVSAVYPSNRYLAPKVRAFIDVAVERFPAAVDLARTVVAARCAASAERPSATAKRTPRPPRAG
jgi:DNA-binding transcriptional LysR family regulator